MFSVLYKLYNHDNKVVGAICRKDGNLYIVRKSSFRALFENYSCQNATCTVDLKIVSKDKDEDILCLRIDDTYKLLFHGSKSGIKDTIQTGYSRSVCDFGKGFYTVPKIEQAESLVAGFPNSRVYYLYCIFSNLNVYRFTDKVMWALYVGVNRGYINISDYAGLEKFVNNVNSHDVVVGDIADDRTASVFDAFINGSITDKCLISCLTTLKLGEQVVFKTQKACNSMVQIGDYALSTNKTNRLINEKQSLLQNIGVQVNNIKQQYHRDGKYIDEILKEGRFNDA